METFTIENLTFTYPKKRIPALDGFSLGIEMGEFLVVCGKSGSGKSTFLRSLKSVMTPHGSREGRILFYGTPLEEIPNRQQAQRIGYVLQNPDNQLVTDKVWHELAFGLESLGYDTETIRLRVAEMASFFGIQGWFMKDVNKLSGGQKQLLNLAAVMAMQPDVLILDEPTSQLDPIAAGDFLDTVKKINRELGTTVIVSEHRLEDVMPLADRAVVMDRGRIVAVDTPARVGAALAGMKHEMFSAMPSPLRVYGILSQEGIGSELACPVDVRQGRGWLTELCRGKTLTVTSIPIPEEPDRQGEIPTVKLKDVWFKYDKNENDVIKDLSMEAYKGELFCLVGGNGTGKTTALTLVSGINRAYRGRVEIEGKNIRDYRPKDLFHGVLGVLPQNPQTIFVEKTVRLDLMEILEGRGIKKEEKEKRVADVSRLVEIEELLDTHPYDLSGGEQQRAALAKVLLLQPRLLLLDEPTKGLDSHFKRKLADILKALLKKGVTIIMVSHDVEFCSRYADRCAMFFDGKIITSNGPRKFFSGNRFYTTAANRMSRHIFEHAVTAEDVVSLCRANFKSGDKGADGNWPADHTGRSCGSAGSGSGETGAGGEVPSAVSPPAVKKRSGPPSSLAETAAPAKGRSWMITAIVMILTPLTVWGGYYLLDDRKYYFISILLIFYAMVPFFAGFESRKPQARELIVLSVLIALAVIGRAAFFMLPQFKPSVALVIISGLALGRESGFLVGAMTAFVSNFIFGQGPWTPWQMFAMGVIGFLAGFLAEKRILGKKKLPILVFGAFAAVVIYGLIVDLWTIFMTTPEPTWQTAAAVYGLAVPFNLIHGVATAFFLWVLEKPMLEKLERVKIKYGMNVFARTG